MSYYAGIGSRDTPQPIMQLFRDAGSLLGKSIWSLRSGGAPGADDAFEEGCDFVGGYKEIFLPFEGFFNRSASESEAHLERFVYNLVSAEAMEMAKKFHPNWSAVEAKGEGSWHIMARNSYQVLGLSLDKPSSFILCWTKGGREEGGTAQAIRIAKAHGIPIFNAGSYPVEAVWDSMLEFLADFA